MTDTLTFDYSCADDELDALVDASPTPEVLQMAAWARVKAAQWDACRFGIRRGGELVGACQVLFRRLAGRRALTLAYAARGPIFRTADVPVDWYSQTYREVERLSRRHRALVLHVDPPVRRAAGRDLYMALRQRGYAHQGFFTDMREIQPRASMMIELPGGDHLDRALPKKMRQHVRRALKRPFVYRDVEADDLRDFMRIIDTMADRQEIVMRPERYFAGLLDAFGRDGRVHASVAYLDVAAAIADIDSSVNTQEAELAKARRAAQERPGEKADERVSNLVRGLARLTEQRRELADLPGDDVPLACALVLYTGRRATYLYGGSTNDFRNYRAPYALIYREMEEASRHFGGEAFVFDFGGVSGETDPAKDARHGGLYEFKSSWGADMIEYVGEFTKPTLPLIGQAFAPSVKLLKRGREAVRIARDAIASRGPVQ